jgi:DNA-binding transcriptional LysR family regulator
MHLAVERGVPRGERRNVALGALTDWDAARIFLEVARCGSFRSAAERLALSINVVRRRIDDFERQTGATLFIRDVHGARLTDEGALVVAAVERMEAASFDLLRARASAAETLSGEVRLAVNEGVATFWLNRRLSDFQLICPEILLDLHCSTRAADVSRNEADIAIHLMRPTALDLKLVRLGRMHLIFYASQKYIDRFGAPRTVAELTKHRLVVQLAEEASSQEVYESLFPTHVPREQVAMKTNFFSANYWAVANGAGVGVLPTFIGAVDIMQCADGPLGRKMIPLDIDLRWSFDIWLSFHPSSSRIPRIRRMIDWLVEAFNSAKYPWFKDEFLHPREFKAVYMGEPLTQIFGGSSEGTVARNEQVIG